MGATGVEEDEEAGAAAAAAAATAAAATKERAEVSHATCGTCMWHGMCSWVMAA